MTCRGAANPPPSGETRGQKKELLLLSHLSGTLQKVLKTTVICNKLEHRRPRWNGGGIALHPVCCLIADVPGCTVSRWDCSPATTVSSGSSWGSGYLTSGQEWPPPSTPITRVIILHKKNTIWISSQKSTKLGHVAILNSILPHNPNSPFDNKWNHCSSEILGSPASPHSQSPSLP